MMRNNSQTLRRQPSTKLSSLNTVGTVSVVFSSFRSFYVYLKVRDPNLKVFSYSFSKPQGLGLEKFQRLEGLKLIHCLCICISSQRRASACLFTRSFTVAHEVENIKNSQPDEIA